MQQQFSRPQWIFVEDIALFIGADMHMFNEQLPILSMNEGFLDAAFPHAQGFYFSTCKCNTGFIFFFDKIIMIRLLIVGDQLGAFGGHLHPPSFDQLYEKTPLTECFFILNIPSSYSAG